MADARNGKEVFFDRFQLQPTLLATLPVLDFRNGIFFLAMRLEQDTGILPQAIKRLISLTSGSEKSARLPLFNARRKEIIYLAFMAEGERKLITPH